MTRLLRSYFIFLILFVPLLAPLAEEAYGQQTPQVWKLEIKGNETFSDLVIRQQIATEGFSVLEKMQLWDRKGHPLNELMIKKDVIRIRKFYHHRGFPNVKVDYKIIQKEGWKRKVVFIIEEGTPILISDIDFTFNPDKYRNRILSNENFVEVRAESVYRPGQRYEPVKKYQVINSFKKVLRKMGFAYAEVHVKAQIDTLSQRAQLTIAINSGPLTTIENIIVKGAETFSAKYIIRESGLNIGDIYDVEEIEEAQRQLFSHPLVDFVTIRIPEQPHDSTLTLALRLQEKKLRTVELSVGFSTQEYIRGRISWIHRNAFDQAHRFSITAKASFIEQFLGIDYLIPYVFNTNSSFVISPFARHLLQPGYELYQWGIVNSLIYRYDRDLTASLTYQFTQNDEVSRRLDINLPDTAKTYDLSSIQLSALYSRGLRLIERGWVVQPTVQISGLFGTSDYQFQKLTLDVRRYIPITNSTTLALRVQVGKIFAAREDSLPRSVRLYLGGSNSVRGWGHHELSPKIPVFENNEGERVPAFSPNAHFTGYVPIGGRTAFAFNFEIRQDINNLINGLSFVVFLDGGQVWAHGVDLAARPLQFGVGGGLRYRSPIGPIRFDIAYKLNPSDEDLNKFNDQDLGTVWDRFGIYLSIGQAF